MKTNAKLASIKFQNGATMVEYIIMASLIAVICIVVVGVLGNKTNALFGGSAASYPTGG